MITQFAKECNPRLDGQEVWSNPHSINHSVILSQEDKEALLFFRLMGSTTTEEINSKGVQYNPPREIVTSLVDRKLLAKQFIGSVRSFILTDLGNNLAFAIVRASRTA